MLEQQLDYKWMRGFVFVQSHKWMNIIHYYTLKNILYVQRLWRKPKEGFSHLQRLFTLPTWVIYFNQPSLLHRFTTSGEGLCCEREPKESKLWRTREHFLHFNHIWDINSNNLLLLKNGGNANRCTQLVNSDLKWPCCVRTHIWVLFVCWQMSLTCLRSCRGCAVVEKETHSSQSPSSHNHCLWHCASESYPPHSLSPIKTQKKMVGQMCLTEMMHGEKKHRTQVKIRAGQLFAN